MHWTSRITSKVLRQYGNFICVWLHMQLVFFKLCWRLEPTISLYNPRVTFFLNDFNTNSVCFPCTILLFDRVNIGDVLKSLFLFTCVRQKKKKKAEAIKILQFFTFKPWIPVFVVAVASFRLFRIWNWVFLLSKFGRSIYFVSSSFSWNRMFFFRFQFEAC